MGYSQIARKNGKISMIGWHGATLLSGGISPSGKGQERRIREMKQGKCKYGIERIGGHCASHSHQKEKACRTCTAFTSQDRTKGKEATK